MPGAKKITLTSSEMAYVLGARPAQMSQWVKDPDNPIPILEKKGRAYIMDPQIVMRWFLRKKINETIAAHRGPADGEGKTSKVIDFHSEKTRLTKAQADEKELKLSVQRGEMIPVEFYKDALVGACQILSSALSSIPAELQRVSPHLSASDVDGVRKVLARVQNALSEVVIEPDDLGLPPVKESVPGD